MLDPFMLIQLKEVFATLQADCQFDVHVAPEHESRVQLLELLNEVTACSPRLSCSVQTGDTLEFSLLKNGENTRIKFRGVPTGHEFTSLLMAILNSDGQGRNFPDAATTARVQALKGSVDLTTYVSLNCTNCPDVVQMLNLMSLLNPAISHEMVDGTINLEEVEALDIKVVPAIYANGLLLHNGRISWNELLTKLENRVRKQE